MARQIYRITGADAREFLQNLVTNDMGRLERDGILYAALLTPQGKYLADFLLIRDGDAILLDVDAALATGLLQRLNMYRLRADVQIEATDLGVSRGTGPAPEGALADPRHPALGWRLYGQESGDDGSDWTALRVAHCIPASGIELTPETYILEAGFERLHGVDFRKGCYVGQEVTARMKHKTELRKGLTTLAIEGEAEPGSAITSDGRPAGTLLSRAGNQAIAYLRFERSTGELRAGAARLSLLPPVDSAAPV
ncbi:folate-binding protein [Pseudooceanicola sp.]|uniref:CAF17-like 4Fe-4S cluster assembly/insertion protein YgfZ n=1 Tax=Pseudooceanicola sp. TaxID=1914328 RepID=UPI002615B8E2|nr:folate-binding protein [Pseudooceanicola sp.]MDF1856244.1 folate-binding protein [Pseudooceanicola sp.]